MVDQLNAFASRIRAFRKGEVGTEGNWRPGRVKGVAGIWRDLTATSTSSPAS